VAYAKEVNRGMMLMFFLLHIIATLLIFFLSNHFDEKTRPLRERMETRSFIGAQPLHPTWPSVTLCSLILATTTPKLEISYSYILYSIGGAVMVLDWYPHYYVVPEAVDDTQLKKDAERKIRRDQYQAPRGLWSHLIRPCVMTE
jgi:hypothetical protein